MKYYKLKNLLSVFRNGATIKQTKNSSGVPISRIETISNGTIDFNKVGYADIYNDNYKEYYLQDGDILFSHINSIPHLGKCAIFQNTDKTLIHGMNLLLLRANKNILSKYLFYLLKSKPFRAKLPTITKKSVNQASLSITNLGDIDVCICSLDEQQRIVNILDKAEEIRTKKKLANEKLDEFLKSTFIDMFGDPVTNPNNYPIQALEDVTKFITDGKHGDCEDEIGSGYYFVSAKCINNGRIDLTQARQIKYSDYQDVNKRVKINLNDLLIVNTGATIGKMAIVRNPNVANCITLQKSVAVINIDNTKLLTEYLCYCLKCKSIANVSAGSAIRNLLLSTMRSYKLPIPPIAMQDKFSKIVQKVEAQKEKNQKVIEQMDNLFNSLMQQVFNSSL